MYRQSLIVWVCFLFVIPFSSATEFKISSEDLVSGQKIELIGEWWFEFGEHLSPEALTSAINQNSLIKVPSPASWHDFLDQDKANPSLHGIATYAARISFDSLPDEPYSVAVPFINDAYRIMWMPFGQPEQAMVIGESGDWQVGMINSREDLLYPLPSLKDALLVIYVAKTQSFPGGIREPIALQNTIDAQNMRDLTSFTRALMMGAILIMSIHYMVQYFHWRNNISLLILSLICLVMFVRSLGVSGYTDLILSYFTPHHFVIRLRLEYLSIIVGPPLFWHFIQSLLNEYLSKRFIISIWVYTLTFATLAMTIPFYLMTKYLLLIQLHLGIISVLVFYSLLVPVLRGEPFARLMLAGTGIIVVGVLNDLFASVSDTYHIYLIEFFGFLFLIFQAQLVGIKLNETVNLAARLKSEKQKLEHKHDRVVLEGQLDHLTGLYNRKAFSELFSLTWQSAMISQETVSIIIMDLDHFKEINDTHGHLIGDEVLVYTASLLRSQNLRKGDFISRYGGEEFVVVLPDTHLEDAYNIAQNLRKAIAYGPAYQDEQISLTITASLGVYATIPKEENYQHALAKADEALYKAKDNGRNCVVSLIN
ncbi:GGDEF domain-containing protein [Reinekea forsetii]|nr:GGDEF domain-containing protein [Reinekea forsetii]